jgi:hypothetical protein
MKRIGLFSALVVLAQLSQAGEMYRWVDKDGKVHFSDKPPPAEARQTQQMAAPKAELSSEPTSGSAADQAARMRQTSEAIRADRDARQQQKAETAANKAKLEQACKAAKAELERFERAARKFLVDENNERRDMTDDSTKVSKTTCAATSQKTAAEPGRGGQKIGNTCCSIYVQCAPLFRGVTVPEPRPWVTQ